MWFKKKKAPKTVIEKLKASYEKMDFENLKKMRLTFKKFISIQNSFAIKKDKLEKQIEQIGLKLDGYTGYEKDLKELEQVSAKGLKNLLEKELTREDKTERRKFISSLNASQYRLKTLGREKNDYSLTEQMLESLYVDLCDCLNILDHMTGSLRRNIDRVMAANFFSGQENDEPEDIGSDFLNEYTLVDPKDRVIKQSVSDKDEKTTQIEKLQNKMNSLARELGATFESTIDTKNNSIEHTFGVKYLDHSIFYSTNTNQWCYRVKVLPYIKEYSHINLMYLDKNSNQVNDLVLASAIRTIGPFITEVKEKIEENKASKEESLEALNKVIKECELIAENGL